MAEKIKRIFRKIKRPPLSPSMKWIYACSAFAMLILLFILGGWAFNWWSKGSPDVGQLMSFWDKLVDAKTLAFISFVAYALVDNDNDGVPDKFEGSDKDDRNKSC